jgi:hypothetical protein
MDRQREINSAQDFFRNLFYDYVNNIILYRQEG